MNREDALKLAETNLTQLVETLAQGESETLRRYLAFQARFHHYSFRNVMMIAAQRPEATYIAGFHAWRKLGRYVRRGESGIAIFAPLVGRKRESESERDAVSGETATRKLCGFRVVHVFDVTQTDGAELPSLSRTSGDPGDYLPRLESLVRQSNLTLRYEPLPAGQDGQLLRGEITINDSLAAGDRFTALVHEFAHALLHTRTGRGKTLDLRVRETEAEAVAYVVSQGLGLDSAAQSVDYIQLYRGDAELLSQSLSLIQQVSAQILSELSARARESPTADSRCAA